MIYDSLCYDSGGIFFGLVFGFSVAWLLFIYH
jgi:hypothetical protein